jgi:DNA-binding transcriptional LysR family regulator
MEVANLKGLKQGQLRLAVITTAKYVIPRLLGPFCQRYPGIDVSLTITNHDRVIDRLNQNLDDLYIVSQPPKHLDIEYHSFVENPLVVLAPSDHPLAQEKNISLKRLAEEPFIMREPGSGTRRIVQQLFEQHKISLRVKLEIGSNEAIKQAVAGGMGISVLSLHSLFLEDPTGPLTILDVKGFPMRMNWYVVYPLGKQLSVVAHTFFEYLLNEGKQVADLTSYSKYHQT